MKTYWRHNALAWIAADFIERCMDGKVKWMRIFLVIGLLISGGCLISGFRYLHGGVYWYLRIGCIRFWGMVVLSILTLFFSVYGLICYEKRRKQKKTESLEKDFMHRTEMVMKIFLVLFVVALFFQIDYHFTLALGRGYLL